MPLSLIPLILAGIFSLAFVARMVSDVREREAAAKTREAMAIKLVIESRIREADRLRQEAVTDPWAPGRVQAGAEAMCLMKLHLLMQASTRGVVLLNGYWPNVVPEVRA